LLEWVLKAFDAVIGIFMGVGDIGRQIKKLTWFYDMFLYFSERNKNKK